MFTGSYGSVVMVPATKLKTKFGPEEDQSKKRMSNEFEEEVHAKKKQKLDCVLSSQCLVLLKVLMDHPRGWVFNVPVDPVKLMVPDYFSVISNPMDLGTVKSKLLKNEYRYVDEFAADVRLTFNNALMYNPMDNWVHKLANELKEVFEVRWELLKTKKVSKLSRVEGTESSISSREASTSSRRSFVEEPKVAKEKSEKRPLLSKPLRGQIKKDSPLRMKKHDQDLRVSSAVKIPNKGSDRTPARKCGSCGRTICICFKSCTSSRRDASTLTDCKRKNTSGSRASESYPNRNRNDKPSELKTYIPDLPLLHAENALRAAMIRDQYADVIVKARNKNVLDQSNKADLIKIQIEKEEMERTQQCEKKARIEAGMRATKIAAQIRAQAELKQKREKQRLELEKMKKDYDFDENNHWRLEKDLFNLCGSTSLRRGRLLLKQFGLVLRNDYWPELEEIEPAISSAMRLDDLEEGEIL
ncbi:Transcription factor GTE12 [Cardamine amara subsp. amara]|uniref:Transcription factor GTE12 n=1 Tax=Cardamine amara subsp. amara TaxID=228776 RepID=A0ABD1BTF7_CARAN